MTYHGAGFPGQQHGLYGSQQAGFPQPPPPPPPPPQQHPQAPQQPDGAQLPPQPQALYGRDHFYAPQQPGHFVHPSQYYKQPDELRQQRRQQHQPHQPHQQETQLAMALEAFSPGGFDAGARFAPAQHPHYASPAPSSVMAFPRQSQPAPGSCGVPAAMSPAVLRSMPGLQHQHHQQQHMYQGSASSPQLHHQPSPSLTHLPQHKSQPPTPRPLPRPQPLQQQQQQPPPPPQQVQQLQPHHRNHQQQPSPQPPHRTAAAQQQQPSPAPGSAPFASESSQATPPTQEPPPPTQQEIHFVNPQDILQPPPPRPPPPVSLGGPHGPGPRAPDPTPQQGSAWARSHSTAVPVKSSPTQAHPSVNPAVRRAEPRCEPSRVRSSPHSSVTNSPALSTRSPSIAKKSPAIPPKPRPVNTGPIMVAIAEECLDKARSAVHDVAMSLHPERVDEYQKLIATALSCLEATLQNCQLSPREEARVRLRYAATLQEETGNLMEAEMALGKGITLCDKHRLVDLKYCMQYLMLKVLFQRSHKAALKAVDGHISDCKTFKHVQWYYAFRLLKSAFYAEMGNASDAAALENIRSIQHIANTRGDNALSVLASILEGLSLLKTSKDGSIEKVQACIAQIAKFQFDPTVKILQLDVLVLVLDFAASLHHQSPDSTSQKLRLLQMRMDECHDWHDVGAEFLVPIKKQPSNAKTVSDDTAAIVRAGEADSAFDHLVMSFMTKVELQALVFTFSGLAKLHKPSAQGRRSQELWREGATILDNWDGSTANVPYGPPVSLATAIRQRSWRVEAHAYLSVLLGLTAASHCQWETVRHLLGKLRTAVTPATQPAVKLLSVYLTGVYHQGTGNLEAALHIFRDKCFAVPQGSAGVRAGQREIALLAGLNRLWIMQHPMCRRDQETQDLIEQLQPHCTDHWNIDLRTAWHNVVAALETEPPQQLNQQKQHIHAAMAGSKVTNNNLGAAVTLCIMRSRFFENVIGEQALKSARAAAKQAQRSGNILWQSVADGMLAQSYEVQGQRDEARHEWDKATKEARDAFAGNR